MAWKRCSEVGGPSLPSVGQWQMPGKHRSPQEPLLGTRRGAGQARLRAAGPGEPRGAWGSRGKPAWPRLASASAVSLCLTPRSISKRAWGCVCLSGDRGGLAGQAPPRLAPSRSHTRLMARGWDKERLRKQAERVQRWQPPRQRLPQGARPPAELQRPGQPSPHGRGLSWELGEGGPELRQGHPARPWESPDLNAGRPRKQENS